MALSRIRGTGFFAHERAIRFQAGAQLRIPPILGLEPRGSRRLNSLLSARPTPAHPPEQQQTKGEGEERKGSLHLWSRCWREEGK